MGQFDRKLQSQPKHPKGNSGASRAAVIPSHTVQPGWKGPGFVKKVKKNPPQQPSTAVQASPIQRQLLPVELQQLLLNIIRDTFLASQELEDLKPALQNINDALIRRDFEAAFGTTESLEDYSVRWSPSRALAYANLLASTCSKIIQEEEWIQPLIASQASIRRPATIISFGGGVAEVLAFAGLLRYLRPDETGKPGAQSSDQIDDSPESLNGHSTSEIHPTHRTMEVRLVDLADWAPVISNLHTSLRTPPVLSKYASVAARSSNKSLIASQALGISFIKANIFEFSTEDLCTLIGPDSTLLTLFFTLNDLYISSISQTTAFLLKLTAAATRNSLLLVVDSPGAHSEVSMMAAGEKDEERERKSNVYPMHWLMDKVLLDKGVKKAQSDEPVTKWKKILSEESRLNKLEEGLRYPVLENLKMQVHLFRRL